MWLFFCECKFEEEDDDEEEDPLARLGFNCLMATSEIFAEEEV